VGNLNPDNDDDSKPITLIVDASGLTITKKGDYIEQKWIRKKKEFIKLHIAVDAKSEKIISFSIVSFFIGNLAIVFSLPGYRISCLEDISSLGFSKFLIAVVDILLDNNFDNGFGW
jgi:hypothetical protein